MKKIYEIKTDTAAKRINFMQAETSDSVKHVSTLHVHVSKGNRKTGDLVPSVSLRPVVDCKNCKACCKLCYDLRNDCVYTNVMKTRAKNAAILKADRARYFAEINEACKLFTAFRWHVGGDIVDYDYFVNMVQIAKNNKHCNFLAFTKNYHVVNLYLKMGHKIPDNLQIIFSGWVGLDMDNPYNLPTSHPLFVDGTTSNNELENSYRCTGNCTECLLKKQGCWALKQGESVTFDAH